MISKLYLEERTAVQVTFTLPGNTWADHIDLALAEGDRLLFKPFRQDPSGDWTLTISLPKDKVYHFNYMSDTQQWVGDKDADGFEFNPLDGTSICLLDTHLPLADEPSRDFRPEGTRERSIA